MKAFSWLALVLVVGLYVPYFFLPVMDYRGPILGAEGFVFCLLVPPMWPIALGHFALWFGIVALALQRWRAARNAALVALVVSFQSWGMMFEGHFPGQLFKLASMSALLAAAVFGSTQEKKNDSNASEK